MDLSAMKVAVALAVNGVVKLPTVANVWTVPGMNAVVAAPAVAGVVASDVAVPGMRVATRHEAGEYVTGGE